jgi:hypothetical protein
LIRLPHALAAAVVAMFVAGPAVAGQDAPKRDWRQEKCFRYARGWEAALSRYGEDGLSAEFVAGNVRFIHSGCADRGRICPSTAKDRTLADVLAISVVNAGMSTTFLPFDCPR